MPFERLELSILKNSSSIRTVRAIRSRKLISRLNGSSYLFEKNHQLFELLKLSVQEIHQPFKWLKLSVPTRQDFETIRHALLNDACRYFYVTQTVVTFLFFVYLRLILSKIISFSQLFPGKKFKKTPLVMVFH